MTDRLKQTWQDTRFRQPDRNHIDEILEGKRSTALQNLARRYRRFSLICGACIITSLSFLNIRFIPEADRLLLSGAFALYFFIASMMDLWLSNGITKIDCLRMSVSDVARKAFFYRKRHFIFMAILIPMAIMLFTLTARTLTDDMLILACMGIGALTGLALGIREFCQFMADYRDITTI